MTNHITIKITGKEIKIQGKDEKLDFTYVKDIAHDVLRHRIILTYEADAEEVASEDIISRILDTIPVP